MTNPFSLLTIVYSNIPFSLTLCKASSFLAQFVQTISSLRFQHHILKFSSILYVLCTDSWCNVNMVANRVYGHLFVTAEGTVGSIVQFGCFCSFQNNSCVLHSEAHSNLAFPSFTSLICHVWNWSGLVIAWSCVFMPTSVPDMFSSSLKIEAVVPSKLMDVTVQNKAEPQLNCWTYSPYESQQCVTEGRLLWTLRSVWCQWNIPWSIFYGAVSSLVLLISLQSGTKCLHSAPPLIVPCSAT